MRNKPEINTPSKARNLFSKNIKRLRAEQGISQIELAKRTGLTHNFINDIENAKKWISADTLDKVSQAFKVDVHQLFLPDAVYDSNVQVLVEQFKDSVEKSLERLTSPYLSKNNP